MFTGQAILFFHGIHRRLNSNPIYRLIILCALNLLLKDALECDGISSKL